LDILRLLILSDSTKEPEVAVVGVVIINKVLKKFGQFIDPLRKYYLPKKNSAPWNKLRDISAKCIISSCHRHKHNILLHTSVLCGELFDEAVSDTAKLARSKQMPPLRE
jgi:hypothetical protein